MTSGNERRTELEHLIRNAHAQLGTLQCLLINAYERKLNPRELGLHIAGLGHQITVWERERVLLPRYLPEPAQPVTVLVPNSGAVSESSGRKSARRSRSARSLNPSTSRHQTPDQTISIDLRFA